MTDDLDLDALVRRVPAGWSEVRYRGRRWGLRRTDQVGGRTVAIAAEELGGTGWVSTNVLHLTTGAVLKPCEMPAEQVLDFLRGWSPLGPEPDPVEIPLAGGNMGGAARVGATVLRPSGPWSPTVQRLLRHLRNAGLDWVPAPLGVDEHGRDVTSFLPGTVPSYPLPSWIWSDEILVAVATRLGQLHRASASFAVDDAIWRLPTHQPAEVICHNDFAPYNTVFTDRRVTGVIDWDTASPGPRIWDVAYLAYRWVPLTDLVPDGDPSDSVPERARRLRLLTDVYGHGVHPAAVVATAVDRIQELAAFTLGRADAGHPDLHAHVAAYRRDLRWMTTHADKLASPATV
ncbi:phosphotransferase enzyme family protein [Nakamurella flava]|nr:aminoglycoside phosphotransferase family protein [Nakamurella flava]